MAVRTARTTPKRRVRGGKRVRRQEKRPGELRHFFQLVACGSAFVLLVAAKLLIPQRLAPLGQALSTALERNMDVQAVFSSLGRAFSGENLEEVYQAVFRPLSEAPEAGAAADMADAGEGAAAGVSVTEDSAALEVLHGYRPASEAADAETEGETGPETGADGEAGTDSTDAVVALYTSENLPGNVRVEQAILNFRYAAPVEGTLSSGFGYRDHPLEGGTRFHYGVDLAAAEGTAITCFADGTITAVGDSSSYGKYCVVSHEGGFSSLYAHCSKITASSGSSVSLGEKIAEVGATGMATGPHLHFELTQNGVYLNPVYYVS